MGVDMKTLKMPYHGLIKSKLEYGNETYESTSETNLNKALKVAIGAFRNSLIERLDII